MVSSSSTSPPATWRRLFTKIATSLAGGCQWQIQIFKAKANALKPQVQLRPYLPGTSHHGDQRSLAMLR